MKPVVYIVGPTASGKTGLSVELAKQFSGEIIAGDSMQVYRGMHIASAAPNELEKQSVPHHLFEFLSPAQSFSVSQYTALAGKAIHSVHQRNRLPFVVGGTGLYISALADNIEFGDEGDKTEIRLALEQRATKEGWDSLYRYLQEIDPISAEKISPNDKKRILRAVEIFEMSGMPKSTRDADSKRRGPCYQNGMIGLAFRNRELLYNRINRRVDAMLENGLVAEAEAALNTQKSTAAQAIGHKELFPYFRGEKSLDECIEHLKMQTRRYAKRQMTWFTKMPQIQWIYMDEEANPLTAACQRIKDFLGYEK